MTELDLSPLQKILAGYAKQGRTALLPALQATQAIYGYLPEPVAAEVSRALQVPLADVYGVIEFYALLYSEPASKAVIHVCDSPACAMAGAEDVIHRLTRQSVRGEKGTEGVNSVTIERAPCLGLCEQAPALLVQDIPVRAAVEMSFQTLLSGSHPHQANVIGGSSRFLTANCGRDLPTSLEEYERGGGYSALRSAIQGPPDQVISEIKASGLFGRGGAAFPTGLKLESAARSPDQPKYAVCNADEAEPGTFKDRILMEDDPHRVLEGLILSAYAVGAAHAYWYIRGEYIYAYEIVQKAVQEATRAGYAGSSILGSPFSLEIELRRGAGAYICGEETALFESIEGKRGFPRVKPPFPTTHGLFGQPTVINNVETLANIPLILGMGAAAYRKIGTEKSPGPKLFCLSGDVVRPGLYEVPLGTSFRTLLFDLAGGIRSGHQFQAALIGGAAGAFATPHDLDVALTFEDLRGAGLPLGSGVIMVCDETRDLRDILLRLGRFFAHESCGKCYPCQLGTQRQVEILERLAENRSLEGDIDRLQDVGWTMTDASLCGLGQTAASAVLSALKHWPEIFAPREPGIQAASSPTR